MRRPPELERLSDLAWHPSGQVVLRGELLEALHALDAMFVRWASGWNATNTRFPMAIAARELAKVDYFSSFPHLASFACTLDPRAENLRGFAAGPHFDERGGVALADLAPVEHVLTPAACYHVYVDLQGRTLDRATVVTTLGTCFRREEKYEALRRQWSFSMREIVCVGSADEVKAFLASFEPRVAAAANALGITLSFEQATDPFFDPRTNPKIFSQMLDPLKKEMTADDGLAIGSINFHRNFFGEAFGIVRDGAPVFTGCVAFGLERWIYTLLREHVRPEAVLAAIASIDA